MGALAKLFGIKARPITHNDVAPARRDPEKEAEVKAALVQRDRAIAVSDHTAWRIRERLAGNTLKIVSGER